MRTSRPSRAIHLIDIENLAGQPRPSAEQVERVREMYETVVHVDCHDHVVVAANHGAAPEVGLTWPGRLVIRSGHNGADLALLDVANHESIAERFDEVVIASGDGIFADLAAWLTASGVPVRVVSRPESLSRRLQLAAGEGLVVLTFNPAPQGPLAVGEVA